MTKKASEKDKKPKKSRNIMYSESVGCLPRRWLEGDLDKETILTKNVNGEEVGITHSDDTPVVFYPNATFNIKRCYTFLEKVLPPNTEFAIMVHDNEENGVLEHVHIAMSFSDAKTVSAVRKMLELYDESKEKFIELITPMNQSQQSMIISKRTMFSYLPHMTRGAIADEKVNYRDYLDNPQKCLANFDLKKYVLRAESEIKSKELDSGMILMQLVEGELSEWDLISPHSDAALTQFYLQNKQKCVNALDIANKRYISKRESGELKVEIIYVSGAAGSGKTNFAKEFASKKFKNYFVTGSQNDPLQDYMGEECVIFDDARASDFDAQDWLKLLDPFTKSSTKSRYFNKVLRVKCLIITTTEPFEDFFIYAKNKGGSDEPLDQFIRRFTTVIEVESDLETVLKKRIKGERLVPGELIQDVDSKYRSLKYTKVTDIKKVAQQLLLQNNVNEADRYYVCRLYAVVQLRKGEEKFVNHVAGYDRKQFKISYSLKELDEFVIHKIEESTDNVEFAEDILKYF